MLRMKHKIHVLVHFLFPDCQVVHFGEGLFCGYWRTQSVPPSPPSLPPSLFPPSSPSLSFNSPFLPYLIFLLPSFSLPPAPTLKLKRDLVMSRYADCIEIFLYLDTCTVLLLLCCFLCIKNNIMWLHTQTFVRMRIIISLVVT